MLSRRTGINYQTIRDWLKLLRLGICNVAPFTMYYTTNYKQARAIASGGDGIQVFKKKTGKLQGVDAVIDKDRAGAKLAEEVDADIFLILSDVEYTVLNFGTDKEEPVRKVTVEQAKKYLGEGHFKAGSMGSRSRQP